jgi:hypothetical protein
MADTIGISYGVCQENLTENMYMCHIAPSSRQRTHPCIPENHRVCDLQHGYCSLSYLLVGLSPLWFYCFPNWKWNWRDDVLKQYVTSKGNRKRYSTALRKMMLLKHGKNDGISVYIPPIYYSMVNLVVRFSIGRCPSKFTNITVWELCIFDNKMFGCGKFTTLTPLSY